MTQHQKTVLRYMEGFRKTDREQILSCLTDDVVWKIPGAFETRGKAAFTAHIVDEGFKSHPQITVLRLIEGEGVVVAEGFREIRHVGQCLSGCDFEAARSTYVDHSLHIGRP
jgi:uncharacterized protein